MRRIAVIIATVICTLTLSSCEDEFKTMCVEDLGGKVISDTKVNNYTGMTNDGKFVNGTTTETTRFCIVDGEVVAQS